ncbi:hypothetical protein [Nonomuraea sp. NEAU-A123]|uniref:hypothetical protein n=1 Tax=Nonomuraea sp. NEAU-A123 TaxID=2839649 RepID=UPI001BE4BEE7|nr:hypothetical protein [Nonomuraea sp. NEAU-A123]MBT2235460.1 hypothetical protein [Nonomuraea sp. NEAU-A123]
MLTTTITFGANARGAPVLAAMTALGEQLGTEARWSVKNPRIHPQVHVVGEAGDQISGGLTQPLVRVAPPLRANARLKRVSLILCEDLPNVPVESTPRASACSLEERAYKVLSSPRAVRAYAHWHDVKATGVTSRPRRVSR